MNMLISILNFTLLWRYIEQLKLNSLLDCIQLSVYLDLFSFVRLSASPYDSFSLS
jgi:hypothetical protein